MNTSIINIKTDSKLKSRAQKIARDLGFNLSSVINAYLKQFVRTKAINFTLFDESHPTAFAIRSLKESEKDIKTGRVSPTFTNAADAIKWLGSDTKKR